MAKGNGKREIPEGFKYRILKDLEREKPELAEYDEWFDKKAQDYGVEARDLRRYVAEHTEILDIGVRLNAQSLTQKLATELGATRARALQRLNEALDAEMLVVRVDKWGQPTLQKWVPDWGCRLGAIERVMKIYGGYAPTKVQVEHDVSDELASLTKMELATKLLEISTKLRQDPEIAAQIIDATPGAREIGPHQASLTAGAGAGSEKVPRRQMVLAPVRDKDEG